MFTGLIEATGTIQKIVPFSSLSAQGNLANSDVLSQRGATFYIKTDFTAENVQLGDSIAVNGVCTTVTLLLENGFTFDASPETLQKTSLQWAAPGQLLNLEKPLLATAPVGGHFVTGHVDTTAVLIEKKQEGNSWVLFFEPDSALSWQPLLVAKGSVCVNGISLTVNTVSQNGFSVAIIPHTWEKTTISGWHLKEKVNLEFDILGKYIVRFLEARLSPDTVLEPLPTETLVPSFSYNEVKQ